MLVRPFREEEETRVGHKDPCCIVITGTKTEGMLRCAWVATISDTMDESGHIPQACDRDWDWAGVFRRMRASAKPWGRPQSAVQDAGADQRAARSPAEAWRMPSCRSVWDAGASTFRILWTLGLTTWEPRDPLPAGGRAPPDCQRNAGASHRTTPLSVGWRPRPSQGGLSHFSRRRLWRSPRV